jgi:hypothetical protein
VEALLRYRPTLSPYPPCSHFSFSSGTLRGLGLYACAGNSGWYEGRLQLIRQESRKTPFQNTSTINVSTAKGGGGGELGIYFINEYECHISLLLIPCMFINRYIFHLLHFVLRNTNTQKLLGIQEPSSSNYNKGV